MLSYYLEIITIFHRGSSDIYRCVHRKKGTKKLSLFYGIIYRNADSRQKYRLDLQFAYLKSSDIEI